MSDCERRETVTTTQKTEKYSSSSQEVVEETVLTAQENIEMETESKEIETFTNTKDRKGLLMAGADRAIRELMFIFKDDPIETPLEEATMSVWARMQLEE